MIKFVGLVSMIALLGGCGWLRGMIQDSAVDTKVDKKDMVERDQDKKKDETPADKKDTGPAPDYSPVPKDYTPTDFPAGKMPVGLSGDFYGGSPMPGFDGFRSPNATSPNRGYYFRVEGGTKQVIRVERVKDMGVPIEKKKTETPAPAPEKK